MTPEPCPTCKGLCCVDVESDDRWEHVEYAKDCSYSARYHAHACPDCDDGTYEVCSDPEPFIRERSVKDEREDVLAFLRHALTYPNLTLLSSEEVISVLHDAIEAGAHVEASKKENVT